MAKMILRRLLYLIPVLIGATLIVFVILQFAEGDPGRTILGLEASQEEVDAMNESLGLNDPILVQYGRYMWNLLQGDLGVSYKNGASIADEISQRIGNTLALAFLSIFISVIISLPLGVIAALKRNSLIDQLCMIISMIGLSMPGFWLGILLILWFALQHSWFPISGAGTFAHIVLPAITVALRPMSSIARTARSSMLDELSQDYLQTARSKGIRERTVIIKHALKNSLIPTVTMIGLQLGTIISSSVVVEMVFAWPGMGRYMLQSINSRDIPAVMGCIILFVVIITIVNLIVDIIYGFIDPRFKDKL